MDGRQQVWHFCPLGEMIFVTEQFLRGFLTGLVIVQGVYSVPAFAPSGQQVRPTPILDDLYQSHITILHSMPSGIGMSEYSLASIADSRYLIGGSCFS